MILSLLLIILMSHTRPQIFGMVNLKRRKLSDSASLRLSPHTSLAPLLDLDNVTMQFGDWARL